MLHLVNNACVKGVMFLSVGNVLLAADGDSVPTAAGALARTPVSGVLLLAGLFAVTGSPPFGLFLSEFSMLTAAFQGGHYWLAAGMLALLAVIFVSLSARVLDAVYGHAGAPAPESPWMLGGPIALALVVLMLGLWIPGPLLETLSEGARALGGWGP
jgi:hydrogenase-4 component F